MCFFPEHFGLMMGGMRKCEVWEKSHMGTLRLKLQLGLRKQRCTIAVWPRVTECETNIIKLHYSKQELKYASNFLHNSQQHSAWLKTPI